MCRRKKKPIFQFRPLFLRLFVCVREFGKGSLGRRLWENWVNFYSIYLKREKKEEGVAASSPFRLKLTLLDFKEMREWQSGFSPKAQPDFLKGGNISRNHFPHIAGPQKSLIPTQQQQEKHGNFARKPHEI